MSLHYFGLQKPIFARNGWEIPQPNPLVLDMHKQSEELIRIRTVALVDDMLRKGMSGLIIRSVSSHLYDCVGMIFASRRAWIDINHMVQIFTADGYRQIGIDELSVGDVVVYTIGEKRIHVGLVTSIQPRLGKIPNVRVLSKWGKDGEVEHQMEDVPQLLGQPNEFWTERIRDDSGQVFRGY